MSLEHVELSKKIKVGIFTVAGLAFLGLVTVFVNDRPFWWRPCELVKIHVEDATGLKAKSPVRSLGLQIGYLKSVDLTETHVTLGICITAPVEVLSTTRAYIRVEGFLGDKFVELKPVRHTGYSEKEEEKPSGDAPAVEPKSSSRFNGGPVFSFFLHQFISAFLSTASAEESAPISAPIPVETVKSETAPDPVPSPAPKKANAQVGGGTKEIPVGEGAQDFNSVMKQVDGLVKEMTHVASNLRKGINPDELRGAIQQLNRALENASRTLSPEGGLTTTAQRTLSKLEDAVEQLRDQLTRINQGQGSVGRVLNDDIYADELLEALKNLNAILGRASRLIFRLDISGEQLPTYDGGRGTFQLGVWTRPDRYYLLGITQDPRGKTTNTTTSTSVNGGGATVTKTDRTEDQGLLITAMVGKIFYRRIDLSVGAKYGDGTLSAAYLFGKGGEEYRLSFRVDGYSRGRSGGTDARLTLTAFPTANLYAKGGFDRVRRYNGKTAYFVGAGISFTDEDIRLLFTFL